MPSYVLGLSLVRCNGIILMRTLKMNNRFITHGCSSFEKLLGDKYCFLTTSCSNNKQTSIGMYSRNLARGRGSCQFSSLSVINAIAISSPVITMQNVLLYMDSVGHLPWWATIVLATLGIRVLITFPFMIYQHHILAKYLNLQPEIKHLVEQLKIETAAAVRLYKWDEKKAKFEFKKSLKKHLQSLIERDNCHPFKASAVMWIQLPLWISMSFALRNMVSMMPNQDLAAQLTFLSLSTGGFLWVPNLIVPDASLILPICCGLFNLIIIEVNSLKTFKTTKFQKIVTNLLRGISVVMIPIAATVPSCLCLYWTTSSFLGLLQNVLLMSPRFRKFCRIPRLHQESQTPFLDLKENLKKRLRWKSRL